MDTKKIKFSDSFKNLIISNIELFKKEDNNNKIRLITILEENGINEYIDYIEGMNEKDILPFIWNLYLDSSIPLDSSEEIEPIDNISSEEVKEIF